MYRQNLFVRSAGTMLVALFLLLPVSSFAKKDQAPADQAEAQKWITNATKRMYKIDQLNAQYLLYSTARGDVHFGIALARISSIRAGGIRDGYPTVAWRDYTRDKDEDILLFTRGRAESFAAALEYLATEARAKVVVQQEAEMQQFRAQAAAWRSASPKPTMPESAREHQVLAEYAFKERETAKAIHEYEAAVALFPTWPEGQFNLATLAGEQKDYDTAILHMKEYLELVPDSTDAQAAKDSIIIWKDRLNSLFAASANPSSDEGKKGAFMSVSRKSK